MEGNGIVNILGYMKYKFNNHLSSMSKNMDPILDASVNLNVNSANLEETIPNKAESDNEHETELKHKELNAACDAQLEKIRTEDDISCENESLKHNIQIENANNIDLNRFAKRTRRRPNSKSIIQSAIARKEKSFGVYEKPKSRKNQMKTKILTERKKLELIEHPSMARKQALQRKTKFSQRVIEKNMLIAQESSDESTGNDSNIRRSRRILSSENKSSSATVSRDEDAIARAQLMSRLCKCTENKQLYMESESDSQFCTAVDTISDKLIGCSRLVDIRTVPMFRSSTRVPFGVFCESHKQRLIRHNCCPTCGVFCTQGYFAECQLKHHFHKDCKLSIGEKAYCPHCGDSAPSTDIVISMHSSKKPIFLPIQRSHQ